MANSSFFKNTGTSSQLQGSTSASAAAALASEQAALASENAAQTSETNAAASAASALVSKNAAAQSATSASSDASASAASAVTSQTAATSSSANAALTSADATQTAADRVQTGLDRVATNSDAVQTAADRVQTGLDVTSTGASAAAALSSRNAAATSETNAAASAASSSSDATATAADRVQTGLDRTATNNDAIATAADRVQTGLDVTSASNSASAANTSASAASASQIAAAASAAAAENSFDLFDDRYLGSKTGFVTAQTGPALDNDGNALVAGTLFFSADANEMRVYDGAGWIAASSAGSSSLINYHYTATASQTAFSGSDDNSNTLSYTVDNLIVTRNGVVLEDGTDYTATDGSTITLTVAASAGDEINIVAFKSFTTADMVSATNGGTFQGNVDFAAGADVTGNITVTGTIDGRDVATDGTKLDGIEALADVTDTTNVAAAGAAMLTGATFTGAVTATSFTGDGANLTNLPVSTPTLTSLGIANHDDITVDGSGNVGIGNVSPTNKLHVQSSGANYILSRDTTSGGTAGVLLQNGSDTRGIRISGGDIQLHDHSANLTRLNIDSSGRVTMPYQPMVSATRTSNFGSNSAGTLVMPYDGVAVNVGSHYNTSTGLFTSPVSGKYRVTAFGMIVTATGSGVFVYNALQVAVNGTLQQGTAYNYGDGYVHMSGSWIVSVSANDTIGVHTSSCLGNYGSMTIELIG